MHFLHPIVLTECAYPKPLSFIGLSQNFFMLLLFADFYYKAYVRSPAKGTTVKNDKGQPLANGHHHDGTTTTKVAAAVPVKVPKEQNMEQVLKSL